MTHYIRTNSRSYVPSNVAFIDTETVAVSAGVDVSVTKQRLELWYLISGHWNGIKLNRRTERCGSQASYFWNELAMLCKPKNPLWVFAHNMGFDASVLGLWDKIDKGGMEVKYMVTESPPTMISVKWKGCTVHLVDSMNWFAESLEKLGKSIGLEKLDYDKSREETAAMQEYCRRDTEIVEKAMCLLFEFNREHNLGCFRFTAASQAFQCWRHRFMPKVVTATKLRDDTTGKYSSVQYVSSVMPHDKESVKTLEKDAVAVGYSWCYYVGKVGNWMECESYKPGKPPKGMEPYTIGPVYTFDVNSLYPFCMRANKWPVSLIGSHVNMNVLDLLTLSAKHQVIANVEVDTHVRPFPCRINGETNYCLGRFWTTLTPHELEAAYKFGVVKNCSFMAYYDIDDVFYDYVNYFYALKTMYRRGGNKSFEKLCKSMLNSLLGKFAQKQAKWVHVKDKEPTVRWERYCEYNADTGKTEVYRGIGDYLQMMTERTDTDHTFTALPVSVIGLAREYMFQIIQSIGPKNVFYANVDSIHCNEAGRNKLYQMELVSDDDIGYLRYEGCYERAHYRNIRDYTLDGKHTIAGIPSKAIESLPLQFEYDEFERLDQVINRNPDGSVITTAVLKCADGRFKLGSIGDDGRTQFRIIKPGETSSILDRMKGNETA